MTPQPTDPTNIRPIMTKCDGTLGWIATTPLEYPWRIGVIGKTSAETRRLYREAIIRWKSLPDGSRSTCRFPFHDGHYRPGSDVVTGPPGHRAALKHEIATAITAIGTMKFVWEAERLAEAALQVIESAAPVCETCEGQGNEQGWVVYDRQPCPGCGGSGRSQMLYVDLMRGAKSHGRYMSFPRVASSEHPQP